MRARRAMRAGERADSVDSGQRACVFAASASCLVAAPPRLAAAAARAPCRRRRDTRWPRAPRRARRDRRVPAGRLERRHAQRRRRVRGRPRWRRGANAKAKDPPREGRRSPDGALRLESVACDGSCAESLSGARLRGAGFGPGPRTTPRDASRQARRRPSPRSPRSSAAAARGRTPRMEIVRGNQNQNPADDVMTSSTVLPRWRTRTRGSGGREPFVRVDERFTRAGAGAAFERAALGYSRRGDHGRAGSRRLRAGRPPPGFRRRRRGGGGGGSGRGFFCTRRGGFFFGNEPDGAERPKKKGGVSGSSARLASWAASGFRRFGGRSASAGARAEARPSPPPRAAGRRRVEGATLSTRARRWPSVGGGAGSPRTRPCPCFASNARSSPTSPRR